MLWFEISKVNFEEYLARTFPDDDKRSTSGVIHRKLGQKIKNCLLGNGSFDKNFRCMVRRHEFSLLNLPSVGMRCQQKMKRYSSIDTTANAFHYHRLRIIRFLGNSAW